jgi:steroid delta-isomerase-like uncharacterized protein
VRGTVALDEALRRKREETCVGHMTAENAHEFDDCIGFFDHPRYEIVPTGEVYDGSAEVARLMRENVTAFPDFHFDVERMHHADEAVVVEGTFRGTHEGTWRGLPATGRKVEFPMLIVFGFEGEAMLGERIFFDLGTPLRQLGVARDPNSIAGKITTVLNHPITIGRAALRKPAAPTRIRTSNTGSLPPGDMGLPLVGETLVFLRNPYRFLEDRQQRLGNVFKAGVLGRKVVFLAGTEGAEAFYDGENISRSDAHPYSFVDLFGGINMEMYDGPRHLALKSMALSAFDHAAIGGYLPNLQQLIDSTLARLVGEFSATTELRTLAIEAICWNIMGLPPGPETEAITRKYGTLLAGLTSLPVPVPGTPYGRAREARDWLLSRIREVIDERRALPGADGLSRMLGAEAADGRRYSDEEALLEVHHIVIAGFIVYLLMAEVMRQLAEQPELRERCAAEIREHAPDGPLAMDALVRLQTATNVVLETKRFVPLVPLAFGRARRTFTCDGFRVPEGWTVYLALQLNNRDRTIYADPDRFDPDRFGPERAEHRKHPMAFIPQGAEPPTGHRCLGLDYSTFLVLAFLTILVRDYDWELPPQDLAYDWKKLPPEPRDGLRVRLRMK